MQSLVVVLEQCSELKKNMFYLYFIFIIGILCFIIWWNQYTFWPKRNVKGPVPLPFIGNFGRMAIRQQSIGELLYSLYKKYPDEKLVGFHFGRTPALLIKDPDLIKQITVTDFNVFINRGLRTRDTGFSHSLLIAEGEVWKTLRQKMSPSFTPAKLKQMIPAINTCLDRLIKNIETNTNENIDIKTYAHNFTLDSISTSVLGILLDFYEDNSTDYLKNLINEAITPSMLFRLWQSFEMFVPGIHKTFKFFDFIPHLRNFFLQLMKTTINIREENEINRNDLLDALIKFKKQENINLGNGKTLEINDNIIASQAFALYAAGTDTVTSTLAFLLYELSVNPEIQDKLYHEICLTMNKYNDEFNYDCFNDMPFLNAVYNETLRKYNLIEWFIRRSVVDYKFPESDLTIPTGTFITVSIAGFNLDPRFVDDPSKFDPDNFYTDKVKHIENTFLPFGMGPRNCIASRFAELNILMAVIQLLRKFEIKPYSKHQQQFKFNPGSITRNPMGEIWIKILRRE